MLNQLLIMSLSIAAVHGLYESCSESPNTCPNKPFFTTDVLDTKFTNEAMSACRVYVRGMNTADAVVFDLSTTFTVSELKQSFAEQRVGARAATDRFEIYKSDYEVPLDEEQTLDDAGICPESELVARFRPDVTDLDEIIKDLSVSAAFREWFQKAKQKAVERLSQFPGETALLCVTHIAPPLSLFISKNQNEVYRFEWSENNYAVHAFEWSDVRSTLKTSLGYEEGEGPEHFVLYYM